MKILYINHYMHAKNQYSLMNYKNIDFLQLTTRHIHNINIHDFDAVYSPSQPIDVSKYPNTKFIFGPHFSVFPDKNQMDIIRGKNVVYIQPSDWVVKFWKGYPICQNIKIESLPFGVDTYKFTNTKDIQNRNQVFIYFKRRDPNELKFLENFLKNKNIAYTIFDYVKKYNEDHYINYLQNSKFGIWLDAHESQGFALQEALACNVPLLVWNVKFMSQEYGSNYKNIPASTIPYWDERCGEFFSNPNELENTFNKFMTDLNNYRPREYILENISIEKCEKKFINIVNNI